MNLELPMNKRFLLKATAALAAVAAFGSAQAQTTPIKFQLDWRFEGPSAFFLLPAAKGQFRDAKLDVTVDSGNGSGGAVTRVASGTYDLGFADLAALMEFHANNPDAPNKPVAIMMVYNNTPASVMALKKSGIKTPADLAGKKMGAPVFDAGRRAFPIFQKSNNIGNVTWTAMDPPLRETMLVRGDVDAITGFTFTSLLNIEARGVKTEDIVVMQYPDFGVKLYGNHRFAQDPEREPCCRESLPERLHQGCQGSHRQPCCGHRNCQGPRRHHQHRAGNTPLATGHRHGDQQPIGPGRRLRSGQWPSPVADGLASVRCLQHQDPRQGRRHLEWLFPAHRQGTGHPAQAQKISGQASCLEPTPTRKSQWAFQGDELYTLSNTISDCTP